MILDRISSTHCGRCLSHPFRGQYGGVRLASCRHDSHTTLRCHVGANRLNPSGTDVHRDRSITITLAFGGLALIGIAFVASLVTGRFSYIPFRLVVYEAIVGVLLAALYVGGETGQ